MAKKANPAKKIHAKLKRLRFLIGNWHTEGEVYKTATTPAFQIRGMDTYEWVSGAAFILHRVDVMMGDERTELIEIIGYDPARKSYFLQSFDQQGTSLTMYATLEKAGVLHLGDKTMRSTLTLGKNGKSMVAEWERSDNGKKWAPWMRLTLTK